MGPEVPSRARRALPALRRSENEDGRRPSECSRFINFQNRSYRNENLTHEKFGWPTAILFLAPAEGWKGPSGPAGNLWPHLIYSSLERFRKFLEKK